MASKQKQRRLSPEKLNKIRENLLERKRLLLQEVLKVLENEARDEYHELIDTIRDTGDTALAELRESTIFSMIHLKVDELQKIEMSLARMEDGNYGRCADCGQWIDPARIEVMPYAIRCRDCQEKREKMER